MHDSLSLGVEGKMIDVPLAALADPGEGLTGPQFPHPKNKRPGETSQGHVKSQTSGHAEKPLLLLLWLFP